MKSISLNRLSVANVISSIAAIRPIFRSEANLQDDTTPHYFRTSSYDQGISTEGIHPEPAHASQATEVFTDERSWFSAFDKRAARSSSLSASLL